MSAPKSQPETIEKPVECPNCHKIFDYALYPDIRIPGNNKLKKKILRKEQRGQAPLIEPQTTGIDPAISVRYNVRKGGEYYDYYYHY